MADRQTLLVVEDNDEFFAALSAALDDRFDIVRAASADAAQKVLRTKADTIDAMVLDMWLPREDGGPPERNLGLEVLLTAKGRPTHPGVAPEIQVVVVTGHQDLQNAIESQRLGSFRYIVKGSPSMLDDLQRDIQAACDETKGRRIHKAIMEGGRLDALGVLPLRSTDTVAEIAQAAAASAVSNDADPLAAVLRQIRALADEGLRTLESRQST